MFARARARVHSAIGFGGAAAVYSGERNRLDQPLVEANANTQQHAAATARIGESNLFRLFS